MGNPSKQEIAEKRALERALLGLLARLGPSKTKLLARHVQKSAQVVGRRLFDMAVAGLVDARPSSAKQRPHKIWFLPSGRERIFVPKRPPPKAPKPARTEPKPRLPESAYVTPEDIAWMEYWQKPKAERKAMQPPASHAP
jgi:hypothetical protein